MLVAQNLMQPNDLGEQILCIFAKGISLRAFEECLLLLPLLYGRRLNNVIELHGSLLVTDQTSVLF